MFTVKDLMTRRLNTVSPEATLGEAVALMNKEGHRQLPVVEEGKLVGIVSDRDIRIAVNSPLLTKDSVTRIKVLEQYTVAECMTKTPKYVNVDTSIRETAEILSLNKIGALPVLKNEALVGIITVTDLLKLMARQPV